MERRPTPPGEQARTHARPEPAPTATATVDEQGTITGWSEGARDLLGYTSPQIVGHRAARLLADTADTGPAGERRWRQAAGHERWNGTVALRHRDGHRLERTLLAHRRTPHGPLAEWLVVCAAADGPHPPGDSSLGEWAFRQSPCILAVFDTHLRLIRANTAMEHALRLTEDQMRGLRLPDLAPHPVSEETQTTMRLALDSGEVQHTQALIHPAGISAEHGWPASLAPLKDPAGQVHAVCLTAHPAGPQHPARQRMLLLNDASARIGTTPDIRRTAQELADLAVPRLADTAAVDLLEDPRPGQTPPAGPAGALTLERAALRSLPGENPPGQTPGPPPAGEPRRYPAPPPVAQCLAQGHSALYGAGDPALLQWTANDPHTARLRQQHTHSLMVVPLRAGDTTLGVALFTRHHHPDPFTPDDLQLAEHLTAKAAASIHTTTRRPARTHTTTMTLQHSLLPQTLPDQAALDIATRYLPAGGRAGIGGDWFDVIPLSGARVALVVGDVVGHGIRASATMGRVRTAVRTLADVDLPPDELLTHLDDLVLHLSADETTTDPTTDTAGGIGTTCLYAVYDPVTRHCTLARAGHPPPAIVTPDGTVHFPDIPPGPPLGLGGLPFEAHETQLPEGSLLALYTNGLLQTRDHDIDEALDTMFTTLTHPAHTLDTICDRILTTMLTHPPDDDIALLIARTHALNPHHIATWNLPNNPATVTHARHHTTHQLTTWNLTHAAPTTELVVSELVTNAIRYGRPPIQLRLIHNNNTLITEVLDTSNTTPHMRRAHTYDEGGRGLPLIAHLTQRWGTRHTPTGKTVWTEQFLTTH